MEAEAGSNRSINGAIEVSNGEGRGGGGPGGGLPPPVGETSPTHASGALSEWEGPRGRPSRRSELRDQPRSVPSEPPSRISRIRRSGGRETRGGGQSPPIPTLRGGKGEREAGGAGWKRPRTAMGAPIAVRGGGGGVGGAGLLTPSPNLPASARSPMPQGLTIRGRASQTGRDDLSEWEVPRNRHPIGLGADGEPRGNRPPPILESGEAAMALTEMGGGRRESAEGLPSAVENGRGLERSPDRSECGRGGAGAGLKIRASRHRNF